MAILSEAVVNCHVTGDSLEGYTKRSGRNRGRSPRYYCAEQLPGRQYLVSDYAYSKVLSFREFSPIHLTRDVVAGYERFALYSLTG